MSYKKNWVLTGLLILVILFLNLFTFSRLYSTSNRSRDMLEIAKPLSMKDNEGIELEDLQFLDGTVGSANIVCLGEQTHFDAKTLHVKRLIVEYLHKKLGFDVVLYESSLYDMWQIDKQGVDINPSFGVYRFWWDNQESANLWHYYKQENEKDTPIRLGGFDISLSGEVPDSIRKQKIEAYLARKHIKINSLDGLRPVLGAMSRYFSPYYAKKIPSGEKAKIIAQFETLISMIENKGLETLEDSIYVNFFSNIKDRYKSVWSYEKAGTSQRMQTRDSLMAENVKWLLKNVYPGKKAILWTSNLHALYGQGNGSLPSFRSMGAHLKSHFGSSFYNIVFTSYARKDSRGSLIRKLSKQSIERVLHDSLNNNAYIDFKKHKLKRSFYSGIDQGMNIRSDWAQRADLLIYLDEMTDIKP